jgi:hypothetical protein
MSFLRALLRDCRAAAAAEIALTMPFLLALGMGAVELGNYFLDEHRLVKAVRDGARYAARQDFSNFSGCNSTPSDIPTPGTAGSVNENTKLIVQKGVLDSSASDQLPNWSSATFSAQVSCSTSYGGQTMAGIYNNNGGEAPVVIVTASVPYQPVAVSSFGINATGYTLYAQEQAPVAGI